MTDQTTTVTGMIAHKLLRGLAVIIMLGIWGAGVLGVTTAASVATSTEASAHRGRGRWHRGRHGRWRGRRGRWRGRRGRRGWYGRRGWSPGFYIRLY